MALTDNQRAFVKQTLLDSPDITSDDARRTLLWLVGKIEETGHPTVLYFGHNEPNTLGEEVGDSAQNINSDSLSTRFSKLMKVQGINLGFQGFCLGRFGQLDEYMGHGVFIMPCPHLVFLKSCDEDKIKYIKMTPDILSEIQKIQLPTAKAGAAQKSEQSVQPKH